MEMPNSDSTDMDRFLQTMTFAKTTNPDCDCDECGVSCSPFAILEAVENHKRQKLLYDSMSFISQVRTLIKRDGPVSCWKLSLPPGSDPLVEYGGNSWRCILVDQLPSGRVLKMTGKGIIGSSDEFHSRQECHWSEKSAYILPCETGGKSIGFINEKRDQDKQLSICDTSNDIVMYIIKATQDVIDSSTNTDSISSLSDWALAIISGFKCCIEKQNLTIEIVPIKENSGIFWSVVKESSN